MSNYPSPCDGCTVTSCPGTKCGRWKIRYLFRQKQINAKGKSLVGAVREKANAWVYPHPDEYRRYLATDPCDGCIVQNICDSPCEKRIAWWNAKMEIVRKQCLRSEGGRA